MYEKRIVCINGDFIPASQAVVPALDPGLLFGQGLFETILIRDGEPVFIKEHIDRLTSSSAALSITLPFSGAGLEEMVRETAQKNGLVTGAARITLTAGLEERSANLIIHTRSLPYTAEQFSRGLKCGFVSIPRNERSPLVSHKTTSYFENILARREALSKGFDEGLFLNTRGEVAEGTVSNIFLVADKKVLTPYKESGLLPGIMRGAVIDACRQQGIPLVESRVFPEDIANSEEIFITNSLMLIMPVVKVGGTGIGKGTVGEVTGMLASFIIRQL